ncbi:MAG: sulfite exporter TauE/SafE family protein [Phormidesmis sp.]
MIPKRLTQKLGRYGLLTLLSASCFWLAIAAPSQAHWADLATAEITIPAIAPADSPSNNSPNSPTKAEVALIYPTNLTAFADDDASGRLSDAEISRHRPQLQAFFQDRIQLKDGSNQPAAVSVNSHSSVSPTSGQVAPDTHTSLQLSYSWPAAVENIEIDYNLFVLEAPRATCLATISQAGEFTSHVFTPKKTTLRLTPGGSVGGSLGGSLFGSSKWALTLIGVFAWGAAHSMSPGHGKTLVAAYLVGERATPLHAVFLATVTTITHTVGVFALGLVTLFAARYILPEQLYPWLSLASGCMVIAIGGNLLWQRWRRYAAKKGDSHTAHGHDHGQIHQHESAHSHPHEPAHSHNHGHTQSHHHEPAHSHDRGHTHSHNHGQHSHHDHSHHDHSHGGHSHSHLPAAGEPVTWRSLLFLGFSAGLVPCPAALVLLLSAIALGNPLSGLILVVVFSLGLSLVLTVLGLLLVYAKQLFKHLPTTQLSWARWLPIASAVGIVVIGVGISTRSLLQVF